MSSFLINPYAFAAAGATDPNFANVSLLLHGDGANGSTTIIDSSGNLNSITARNGARISTVQAKFGPSSIEFLSSAITGLSVTPAGVFQFGTGNWTVEAWIYQRSQSLYGGIVEIGNHLSSDSFILITGANGFSIYSGAFYGPSANVFTLNTWQHVAVTRSANTLYFFLNGTIVGNSSGYSFTNNLSRISAVSVAYPYGYDSGGTGSAYAFNGYIDDLRITKGIARYQSAFTPPTAPFPDA